MYFKRIFTPFILVLAGTSMSTSAQSGFTYSPEKPQPGQTITVSYTPSEDLTIDHSPIKLSYYLYQTDNQPDAYDGSFTRSGSNFTAQIPTGTTDVLVALKIYTDKAIDSHDNNGFLISLYKGNNPVQGANYVSGLFYGFYAGQFNLSPDPVKGLALIQSDFEEYPEDQLKFATTYLRLYQKVHPDSFEKEIQKNIEMALSAGLKTEENYTNLYNLYILAKLPQQADRVESLMIEKFPNGKAAIQTKIQKYAAEQNQVKKEEMWLAISDSLDNSSNWSFLKDSKGYYQTLLTYQAINSKNWKELARVVKKYHIANANLANAYNSLAWNMQENEQDLNQAKKLSKWTVKWAKNQITNPSETRPASWTDSEFKANNKRIYVMYADTYAKVLIKLGNYKEAYKYINDAALNIAKGNDPVLNSTYALVASKVLTPEKYISTLEKMVKEGKSNSNIKDILKSNYIRHHSEQEYNQYIGKLEQADIQRMKAELTKTMSNEESPAFSLRDLDGKNVDLNVLKGKVVVLDFWATWCGPCIASFSGMQKVVNKYKDDKNVIFLFVNTWENVKNKEENARNFILESKYNFRVILDNDNKVTGKYNVRGIPTKFVLDKNGKIRFKSVGFNGNDEGLVQELSLMINMAKES